MRFKLYKLSAPGFVKECSSEQDIRDILYPYICNICLDEYSITNIRSIDEMLGTPCGCEFDYDIIGE